MKKRYLKLMSLVLAVALGSTPVWACTATPKANLSKPQTKTEEKSKPKQVSEHSSQTTPQQVTPGCEKKEPTKVEPVKKTEPAKVEPTKKSEPDKVEPSKKEQHTKEKFVVDNFKIISTALENLGVTPEELDAMIKEGKNLPEVLEAKDICVKKFKKVLLKEYYAVIKQGVKDEQLTKEEGKMLKYAIKQKVMNWLEE